MDTNRFNQRVAKLSRRVGCQPIWLHYIVFNDVTILFSLQDCSSIVVSAIHEEITYTDSMSKLEGLPNCNIEEAKENARDYQI